MRELKFRGKARMNYEDLNDMGIPNKNGWVIGSLAGDVIVGEIVELDEDYVNFEWWAAVYKNTIGQYTGFTDEDGKEIYEGDIVEFMDYGWNDGEYNRIGEVIFEDGAWHITNSITTSELFNYDDDEGIRVIGDIYENPELLEVE